MYKEPIFLQAAFQERIWGGQKLKTEYSYDIPYERTGEAWVISAHPNGPSVIKNGPLAGKTLLHAWNERGELFNKESKNGGVYPLLVKILDANDNLSVQVHPDDEFAREVEGVPYGKTECWYILSADAGSELILGHHANSKVEFDNMVNNEEWEKLLRRISVNTGDFVYVPSGTIHAIGKGIMVLETQQSSDITYRVYDYDRKDSAGNKRKLHLERAKQVTAIPHQDPELEEAAYSNNGLITKRLVKEKYFTVNHWQLDGKASLELDKDFLQVSVIDGKAEIRVNGKSFSIEKGSHFLLPHGLNAYELDGKAELIVSHV